MRDEHNGVGQRTASDAEANAAAWQQDGVQHLRAGQIIGHYEVVRPLGSGGMSHVFLARDRQENRDVVLKLPNDDLLGDPTSYEHFRREIKIGQMLTHPNIQKLYALFEEHHVPFLVLEYIPGRTLRKEMRDESRQGRPLSPDETVTFGLQIARALAYAHEHHVVHRDLKPENILVTPEGQAKVMDFGIAFVEGARRVTWGKLSSQAGTPDYMAPEQIQGVRGDVRTDIYALGMILYECLAGRLPYDGDNALAIMNQHVNVNPPPLRRFRKDIAPELEEVILKAVRRRPEDRWPTMQAFADALEAREPGSAATLRGERERAEADAPGQNASVGELGLPLKQVVWIIAATFLALIALVVVAQWLHRS